MTYYIIITVCQLPVSNVGVTGSATSYVPGGDNGPTTQPVVHYPASSWDGNMKRFVVY